MKIVPDYLKVTVQVLACAMQGWATLCKPVQACTSLLFYHSYIVLCNCSCKSLQPLHDFESLFKSMQFYTSSSKSFQLMCKSLWVLSSTGVFLWERNRNITPQTHIWKFELFHFSDKISKITMIQNLNCSEKQITSI